MFWAEIWKISEVLPENFRFLEVKFSIYLNRLVNECRYWSCAVLQCCVFSPVCPKYLGLLRYIFQRRFFNVVFFFFFFSCLFFSFLFFFFLPDPSGPLSNWLIYPNMFTLWYLRNKYLKIKGTNIFTPAEGKWCRFLFVFVFGHCLDYNPLAADALTFWLPQKKKGKRKLYTCTPSITVTINQNSRESLDRNDKCPALCKNVSSDICGQRRPRSACASAQSDQGLHCPLTKSLATTECMNREQVAGWYFARAQDDVNPHILRMLEGTFLLDAAQM